MVKQARFVSKPQTLRAVTLLLAAALVAAVASAAPAAPDSRGGGDVRDQLTLERIEADATTLILQTNVSPAFSSYSPQPGVYVVDLPFAAKGPDALVPAKLPDGVASVSADEAMELGSALTRVTIRLRPDVRPETVSFDKGIAIRFGGNAGEVATPAAIVEETEAVPDVPVKVAEAPAVTAPAPPPPVAAPVMAPAPAPAKAAKSSGRQAKELGSVTTESIEGGIGVRLTADGSLDYTAFRLENPSRLVIDLNGVRNAVRVPQQDVDSAAVRRVRVAQFQTSPRPVTRVVLDLGSSADYQVAADGDSVFVAFGGMTAAPRAAAVAPAPTPDPAPQQAEDSVFEQAPAVPVVAEAAKPPAPATMAQAAERHVVRAAADPAAPEMSGGRMTSEGQSKTLSAGERVYTGEPIDLSLKDADVKDVLRTFAQLTGLNIAVDPGVTGTVTVEFVAVPWDQALEIILRQNGLTYTLQGNVMRVGTIDRLSKEASDQRKLDEEARLNVQTVTIIKDLSYAKADAVSTLLTQMASPKGKIIVDQRTNQLVITEVPDYLQTMLNLIDTVDIATPQVVIEARIVETTKNFLQQFGIDWGFGMMFDPALGTGTGLQFPNSANVTGGPFNFGKGNTLLDVAMTDVLGAFDLDIALAAAENDGLARIVSAPKIVTQDNQPAEIQSGTQIPVQTRVNFTTTVQYVDATLRLQVTPQITARDTVIMDVQVQKTEPLPGISLGGATNVPLSTRRAQTRLMVRDGGTTVIGGIYQATENRTQDRVPYLWRMPGLGWLFKNHEIQSKHDELLIFITPKIVRNQ
jgi:type IV pilus assembly protein PilQ